MCTEASKSLNILKTRVGAQHATLGRVRGLGRIGPVAPRHGDSGVFWRHSVVREIGT